MTLLQLHEAIGYGILALIPLAIVAELLLIPALWADRARNREDRIMAAAARRAEAQRREAERRQGSRPTDPGEAWGQQPEPVRRPALEPVTDPVQFRGKHSSGEFAAVGGKHDETAADPRQSPVAQAEAVTSEIDGWFR